MNGVNLPKNEFYSPIRREGFGGAGAEFEWLADVKQRTSISKGSMKSRVRTDLKIAAQNDVDVLQRHIAEMEHYVAWAEKMRTLNGVFAKGETRAAIIRYRGMAEWQEISRFLTDMTRGGAEITQLGGRLEKYRQRFVTSVLALKPSIAFKQLVSMPAMAETVPVASFAKGVAGFLAHPVANAREMMAASPYLRNRYGGMDIERDIRAAVKSDKYGVWRKRKNWINTMMMNIELGDKAAVFPGGWAVYKHNLALGKTRTQAIREMEIVIDRTMQSADLSRMSRYQRSDSPLTRMFTMFLSQPLQQAQRELLAVQKITTGKEGLAQTAKTIAIMHVVLPTILQLVANFGRWDWEDEKRAAIVGPLNGYFMAGQMVEAFASGAMGGGQGGELGLARAARDAGRTAKLAADWVAGEEFDDEDYYRAWRLAAGTAGVVSGAPVRTVMDMAQGIKKLVRPEEEGDTEEGAALALGFPPGVAKKAAGD
jgi:hypothetical protein